MNAPIQYVETNDRRHGADAHWAALLDGTQAGECSLWWTTVPQMSGEKLGVIGSYRADEACGAALLEHACEQLRSHGCTLAVGPMDGTTWRSYRLVTERGPEPPFFLEPDHPEHWVKQFCSAGFTPLAEYTSAVADDLDADDPRIAEAERRLTQRGVNIRQLQVEALDDDLRHIHAVSLASFRHSFLFTPVSESEFLEQYRPLRGCVRPDLVLLAFLDDRPVGFVFAIPDLHEAQRGSPLSTVVLKTLAVVPGRATAGLGNVLLSRVHRQAKQLGFRRVIHALMHEQNSSLNLSARYARPFRRYALFSRQLVP